MAVDLGQSDPIDEATVRCLASYDEIRDLFCIAPSTWQFDVALTDRRYVPMCDCDCSPSVHEHTYSMPSHPGAADIDLYRTHLRPVGVSELQEWRKWL